MKGSMNEKKTMTGGEMVANGTEHNGFVQR